MQRTTIAVYAPTKHRLPWESREAIIKRLLDLQETPFGGKEVP